MFKNKINIIYLLIIILIYIIWWKNNLIIDVQATKDLVNQYDVLIEHASGKIYEIKKHYGIVNKMNSYKMSLMIVYEKGLVKNPANLYLYKDIMKPVDLYYSILSKNINIHKWEKVSGVDICELYLGDKDYLYAEVMQYKLKDSYIKLFLVYTEDVKKILQSKELWPVLSNEDKLQLEIKKITIRITKGQISERSLLFNELKNIFFSNYRSRPSFFIMYNNKEFQTLLGQEIKFITYSDIFDYKRSSVLKYFVKHKKEIINYYLK